MSRSNFEDEKSDAITLKETIDFLNRTHTMALLREAISNEMVAGYDRVAQFVLLLPVTPVLNDMMRELKTLDKIDSQRMGADHLLPYGWQLEDALSSGAEHALLENLMGYAIFYTSAPQVQRDLRNKGRFSLLFPEDIVPFDSDEKRFVDVKLEPGNLERQRQVPTQRFSVRVYRVAHRLRPQPGFAHALPLPQPHTTTTDTELAEVINNRIASCRSHPDAIHHMDDLSLASFIGLALHSGTEEQRTQVGKYILQPLIAGVKDGDSKKRSHARDDDDDEDEDVDDKLQAAKVSRASESSSLNSVRERMMLTARASGLALALADFDVVSDSVRVMADDAVRAERPTVEFGRFFPLLGEALHAFSNKVIINAMEVSGTGLTFVLRGQSKLVTYTPNEVNQYQRHEFAHGIAVVVSSTSAASATAAAAQPSSRVISELELSNEVTQMLLRDEVETIGLNILVSVRPDVDQGLLAALASIGFAATDRNLIVNVSAGVFVDLPAAREAGEKAAQNAIYRRLVEHAGTHVSPRRIIDRERLTRDLTEALRSFAELRFTIKLLYEDGKLSESTRYFVAERTGANEFSLARANANYEPEDEVQPAELLRTLLPWQLFSTTPPAEATSAAALASSRLIWSQPRLGRQLSLFIREPKNEFVNNKEPKFTFSSRLWGAQPETTPPVELAAPKKPQDPAKPSTNPVLDDTSRGGSVGGGERTAQSSVPVLARVTSGVAQMADGSLIQYPKAPIKDLDDDLVQSDLPAGSVTSKIELDASLNFSATSIAGALARANIERRNVDVLIGADQLTMRIFHEFVFALSGYLATALRSNLVVVAVVPKNSGVSTSTSPHHGAWLYKNLETFQHNSARDARSAVEMLVVWPKRDVPPPTNNDELHRSLADDGNFDLLAVPMSAIVDNGSRFVSKFASSLPPTTDDAGAEKLIVVRPTYAVPVLSTVTPTEFSTLAIDYSVKPVLAEIRNDGKRKYHSLANFVEASRFYGFPSEITVLSTTRAEYGRLYVALTKAVVKALQRLKAVGTSPIRSGYHPHELAAAIRSRVEQSPALLAELAQLPADTRIIHVPRIVGHWNVSFDLIELSLDHTFSAVFNHTLQALLREQHLKKYKEAVSVPQVVQSSSTEQPLSLHLPAPVSKSVPIVVEAEYADINDYDDDDDADNRSVPNSVVKLVEDLNTATASTSSGEPVLSVAGSELPTQLTVTMAKRTLIEEAVVVDISDHGLRRGASAYVNRDANDAPVVFAPFLHPTWPFIGSQELPGIKHALRLVRRQYPELMPLTETRNFNALVNYEEDERRKQMLEAYRKNFPEYAAARKLRLENDRGNVSLAARLLEPTVSSRKRKSKEAASAEANGSRTPIEIEKETEMNKLIADWRENRFADAGVEDLRNAVEAPGRSRVVVEEDDDDNVVIDDASGEAKESNDADDDEDSVLSTSNDEEENDDEESDDDSDDEEDTQAKRLAIDEALRQNERTEEDVRGEPEFADTSFIFGAVYYETILEAIAHLTLSAALGARGQRASAAFGEAPPTLSELVLLKEIHALTAASASMVAISLFDARDTVAKIAAMQRQRILQSPALYRSVQRMLESVKSRSLQFTIDLQRSAGVKGLGAKHAQFETYRRAVEAHAKETRDVAKQNADAKKKSQTPGGAPFVPKSAPPPTFPANELTRLYNVASERDEVIRTQLMAHLASPLGTPALSDGTDARLFHAARVSFTNGGVVGELNPLFDEQLAFAAKLVQSDKHHLFEKLIPDGSVDLSSDSSDKDGEDLFHGSSGEALNLIGQLFLSSGSALGEENSELIRQLQTLYGCLTVDVVLIDGVGALLGSVTHLFDGQRFAYRVYGIQMRQGASNEADIARLVYFAEHILLHTNVSTSNAASPTPTPLTADSVMVETIALGRSRSSSRKAVEAVLEERGYFYLDLHAARENGREYVQGGSDVVSVYMISASQLGTNGGGNGSLARRAHLSASSGALTPYARTLAGDWLEQAVEITAQDWVRTDVVENRSTHYGYKNGDTPVRLWTPVPLPHFLFRESNFSLSSRFNSLSVPSIEATTFFSVRCVLVGARSPLNGNPATARNADLFEQKLVYESNLAPDWIKLNDRIVWLPHQTRFRKRALQYAAYLEEVHYKESAEADTDGYVKNMLLSIELEEKSRRKALRDEYANKPRRETFEEYTQRLLRLLEQRSAGRKRASDVGTDNEEFSQSELVQGAELLDVSNQRTDMKAFFAREFDNDEWRTTMSGELDRASLKSESEKFLHWHSDFGQFDRATVEYTGLRYTAPSSTTLGNASTVRTDPGFLRTDQFKTTLSKLRELWRRSETWRRRSATGRFDEDAVFVQPGDARRAETMRNVDTERWRDFMRKYRAPMPWTKLEAMLVIEQPAKTESAADDDPHSKALYEFQVYEHTFIGQTPLKPRPIFRSWTPMSYDTLVRHSAEEQLFVGAPGTRHRSITFTDNAMGQTRSPPVRWGKTVPVALPEQTVRGETNYEVQTGTLNQVRSLTLVFDESVNNQLPNQPSRLVFGAFYIDAQPSSSPVPTVRRINDEYTREQAARDERAERERRESERKLLADEERRDSAQEEKKRTGGGGGKSTKATSSSEHEEVDPDADVDDKVKPKKPRKAVAQRRVIPTIQLDKDDDDNNNK